MSLITLEDVQAARKRIEGKVKCTEILTCSEADRRTGRQVFFKAEHLQTTGAFKIRGALNAVLKLKEKAGDDNHPGVVTHSSGNHGQALSRAATMAGLPCTIVVPKGTPDCKLNAIRGYGADLVECFPSPTARIEMMEKVSRETGKVYISSCDHLDVIAGQGTIGLELLEQVPDLDAILVAASGGGMSSGIAVAVKAIKPDCRIYIVTPEGKILEACLKTGERLWPNPPQFLDTIAEGIKLQQLGHNTFKILTELAEKDVLVVSDKKMIEGMKFSFHRMKQVIEVSAGAAVGALFTDKMAALPPEIKKVAVILCGGNTDIDNLPWGKDFSTPY